MTRFDRMTAKSHSKPCNLLKRLFAERHPKVGEKNPEKVAFRSEGRAPIFFAESVRDFFDEVGFKQKKKNNRNRSRNKILTFLLQKINCLESLNRRRQSSLPAA